MEVSEPSMGAHANLYVSLDTDSNKKMYVYLIWVTDQKI